MSTEKNQIDKQLKLVKKAMADVLKDTNIAKLLPGNKNLMGSGKMLRSRLVLALGNANGVPEGELVFVNPDEKIKVDNGLYIS